LEQIGAKCEREGNSLHIHTSKLISTKVGALSRKNRIPILALAPLLHRGKQAEVPVVEGDRIGPRPVNLHIDALRAMGATVEQTPSSFVANAEKMNGSKIHFKFPSVGATETVLFAGVLAQGITRLENAAVEPEITELIMFLQKMGAIIHLGADRVIEIEGVKKLHGASHRVIGDRNEVVSFAAAAIGTQGDVFVEGAEHQYLISFLNVVRKLGAQYEVNSDGIRFWHQGKLNPINISTDTHPGFMTDWQQPTLVLTTQANGISHIHETIYEDRFGYTKDLCNMGANIEVVEDCGIETCRFLGKGAKHFSTITGVTPLKAASLKIPDIRAGIAHVIAALMASGTSEVEGIEHLDRGYVQLEERLRQLGAQIKRI
jgi:UDP-N-acetylglucosamine 1-carboxyvinyltransferase